MLTTLTDQTFLQSITRSETTLPVVMVMELWFVDNVNVMKDGMVRIVNVMEKNQSLTTFLAAWRKT